jgi:large subunit ribosomal protein L17
MRHAFRGRILNRTPSHRIALRRNMCQSLIEHGEIRTTLVKAKEIKAQADKLLRLAVDAASATASGTAAGRIRAVTLRQRAIAILNDRQIIPAEHREDYDALSDAKRAKVLRARSGRRYRAQTTAPGVKFTSESVIHKLFNEIGPRLKERDDARECRGSYTRIIKLAERRLGDGGALAILQIVAPDDEPRPKSTTKTERKRKARIRYAAYAGEKLPQRRGSGKRSAKPAAAEAPAPAQTESPSPAAETPSATATEEPAPEAPPAEQADGETPDTDEKKAE